MLVIVPDNAIWMRYNVGMQYVAFLRGLNVGGNGKVPMVELRTHLEAAGLKYVSTYIQSGNVIFESEKLGKRTLAREIEAVVRKKFAVETLVAIFTAAEWQAAVDNAPSWWGKAADWKHNLFILFDAADMLELEAAVAHIKPAIERIQAGRQVMYQSLLLQKFGQTSASKLVAQPIYKKMTIRNANTARKIAALLRG